MTSRENGAPQESVNDVDMTAEKLYGASRGPEEFM